MAISLVVKPPPSFLKILKFTVTYSFRDAVHFTHLLTRQTSRATQGPLSSRTLVTEPESPGVTEPLLCLSGAVSLSPEKFNTCYAQDQHGYFQALEMQIVLTFVGNKIG